MHICMTYRTKYMCTQTCTKWRMEVYQWYIIADPSHNFMLNSLKSLYSFEVLMSHPCWLLSIAYATYIRHTWKLAHNSTVIISILDNHCQSRKLINLSSQPTWVFKSAAYTTLWWSLNSCTLLPCAYAEWSSMCINYKIAENHPLLDEETAPSKELFR